MSIQFSFTMKPKKKLFKKIKLDFSAVLDALKAWEKEEQIQLEIKHHDVKVTYCPEGYFWIAYKQKENTLSGDVQSNVAGPGFHAAAISLLERLSNTLNLKLLAKDDTDYFKDKDFEKMRREHFYPWLKFIMDLLCEDSSKTDYKICWNLESYSPKVIPGTVITPIRRFTIEEIKEFSIEGPEAFAKEFFIWLEAKRDARFYRNSALADMNMNCHFVFSERGIRDALENIRCIQNLEKAMQYDCRLPIPKKEYRLLCRLHEQPPLSLDVIQELKHECEIGYRRQEVIHQVGAFTYTVYGRCLEQYDKEKNIMIYIDDVSGNWHNIRITSFHFSDKVASFTNGMFEGKNVEEVLNFPVADGMCRLAIYKPVPMEKSPEGYYYEMTAQMILDHQLLLVTQTFCRQNEKNDILDWFHRIEGKRRSSLRHQ